MIKFSPLAVFFILVPEIFQLKVPMKWKRSWAHMKGFSRSRDINDFVLCKLDNWWRHKFDSNWCKNKNQYYLCKYQSKVIETWHQYCTLRKTPHGTYINITIYGFTGRSKWCHSKHTQCAHCARYPNDPTDGRWGLEWIKKRDCHICMKEIWNQ